MAKKTPEGYVRGYSQSLKEKPDYSHFMATIVWTTSEGSQGILTDAYMIQDRYC